MDAQKDPIIKVVNADTLDEALKLKRQGLKPIVLDMANREFPGGGTLHICLNQTLSSSLLCILPAGARSGLMLTRDHPLLIFGVHTIRLQSRWNDTGSWTF